MQTRNLGPSCTLRSRAPIRLDLAGGWTDVAPFSTEVGGAVVNAAINRYSYTTPPPQRRRHHSPHLRRLRHVADPARPARTWPTTASSTCSRPPSIAWARTRASSSSCAATPRPAPAPDRQPPPASPSWACSTPCARSRCRCTSWPSWPTCSKSTNCTSPAASRTSTLPRSGGVNYLEFKDPYVSSSPLAPVRQHHQRDGETADPVLHRPRPRLRQHHQRRHRRLPRPQRPHRARPAPHGRHRRRDARRAAARRGRCHGAAAAGELGLPEGPAPLGHQRRASITCSRSPWPTAQPAARRWAPAAAAACSSSPSPTASTRCAPPCASRASQIMPFNLDRQGLQVWQAK